MDRFGKGAILIALLIEGFIVYGGLTNPNETTKNILIASSLPLVLVATVFLMWQLQKGET
jgi:hypothetical protein